MAKELPYLTTYKNVGTLFEKIEKAKIPDAFTTRFLADTIGLKGSGDRQLISLLKKLGFIDPAGRPTPEYSRLKNKSTSRAAVADAIRRAYAPLYEVNENVHELPSEELKGIIAQVSGAEEGMTRAITYTFNALAKAGDFSRRDAAETIEDKSKQNDDIIVDESKNDDQPSRQSRLPSQFNPNFRFNIEIHLPSNGTEETYLAIFNALRKSLG